MSAARSSVGGSALAGRGVWLVAFAVSLALYVATMAPGVLWGDSGECQLHVLLGGWYVNDEIVRSHVLYYAIARFLYWLLPVSAATAANLAAALGGAVTIANVAWLNDRLCRNARAAIYATLMLVLSHTLWQLSTGAEVVTTSTAVLSAELCLFYQFTVTRRSGWLALTAFANGLGVSNHNFALLMWPVYAVVLARSRDLPRGRGRALLFAMLALLAGMTPVLILCVDTYLDTGSLGATLKSFLVGHYGSKIAKVSRLPALLLQSVAMTVMNFPTPLLAAVGPGLARAMQSGNASMRRLLLGGALVYTLFGATYDVPDQHTFLVPAFVVLSVLMALGLDVMLQARRPGRPGLLMLVLALLAPVAYLLAPPVLQRFGGDVELVPARHVPYRERWSWFLRPWRAGYDGPVRFARETLDSLPPDAWLVVDPTLSSPLNYVQAAENRRRDVRLDSMTARQPWFPPDPVALDEQRTTALRAGLMFCGSDQPRYVPRWLRELPVRIEPAGHVFRVRIE